MSWSAEAASVSSILTRARNDWEALPRWIVDAYEDGRLVFGSRTLHFRNPAGNMVEVPHDWGIVKGIEGEMIACPPRTFSAWARSGKS